MLHASLSQKMLPTFYQTHLQKQLAPAQFILLTILLNLIQSEKQVRLERLARVFPYPITWGGDKEVYEIDCIRVAARIPC